MFSRVTPLLLALAVTASSAEVRRVAADPEGVVVHEWGTFTSIARADGQPALWMPLDGQSDLPCFVHRYRPVGKADLSATVRMETPVLYFYSAQPATVGVTGRFNHGVLTEWFPQAVQTFRPAALSVGGKGQTALRWQDVRIVPKAK